MQLDQVFFYLLVVFLPTQLGYHTWPVWAMVLGRRIDYLSPTLYLTDVLVLLTFSGWVIRGRKKLLFFISHFSFRRRRYYLFIGKALLLIGFVAANIFFSASPMVAAYAWVKVFEYVLLGWYILRTKPKFASILFYLSIGVLYSSVLALVQFILQRSVGGAVWWLGERTFTNISPGIAQFNLCQPFSSLCRLVLRPYATFPHPNVLGGFLAVTVPLIIYQLRTANALAAKEKLLYIISVAFGVGALILTVSRSAWVVGALGVSMLFFAVKKRTSWSIPIMLATLFLIGVFVAGTFTSSDESVVVREELSVASVHMFSQSPFVGVGLGNFLVHLPNNLVARQIYFLQPVHNIYLLALSEIGIIGIGITVLLVVSFVKDHRKNISMVPFGISFVMLLLVGLVDHYPLMLQQGQLLFTLLFSLVFVY